MPSKGSQVVFIIHPQKCAESLLEKSCWQDFVCECIAKLVIYLESVSSRNTKWKLNGVPALQCDHDLKWGYKLANNGEIKFHSMCDFKRVTFQNLQLLYNEMLSTTSDELIDYSSHTLLKNLSIIIHDFQWERLEIFSPVKKTQKLEKMNQSSFISNSCTAELSDNIVIVIGSLPRSQEELNSYFEWHINTVDDIMNILMPKHLSQLFRSRHNIRLFWLDTQQGISVQDSSMSKQFKGISLMDEFMKLNNGCIIPFSMLGILSPLFSNLPIQSQSGLQQKHQSRLSNCFLHDSIVDMNITVGSDGVFEEEIKSEKNVSSPRLLPTSLTLNSFLRNRKHQKKFPDDHECLHEAVLCCNDNNIQIDLQPVTPHAFLFHRYILNSYKNNYVKNAVFKFPRILLCDSSFTSQDFLNITENTVKDKLYNADEASANRLSCQINIIGLFELTAILSDCLNGESYFCKSHSNDDFAFLNLMKHLNQSKQVVLMESCYKVIGDDHQLTPETSVIFNRYGVLQALNDSAGSFSWFKEHQKRNVLELLRLCLNEESDKSPSVVECVRKSSNKIFKRIKRLAGDQDVANSPFDCLMCENDNAVAFDPSMLESWFCMLPASHDLKNIFENFRDSAKMDKNKESTEFRDGVMSALQQLYATSPQQENRVADVSVCANPTSKSLDLNSSDDIEAFIVREIESCLEVGENFEVMRRRAGEIISVIYSYTSKQENETRDRISATQSKLEDCAFLSASKLRCKTTTPVQKYVECLLQVFLRMEWNLFAADHSGDHNRIESETDEIIQLLRMISLSQSVGKMKEFLCNVLVQLYTKPLGDLLVEIHNDLMIPLPPPLLEFSFEREAEDSFLDASVKSMQPPSTGPFSMLSSVGSQESFDQSNKRLFNFRKSQQIKPIASKQIEVPHSSRYETRKRSLTKDAVKRLFVSPTKETKQESSKSKRVSARKSSNILSKSVSQEDVMKVRRDLFTSPRKRRKKTSSQSSVRESPDKKSRSTPRSKHSVGDTPAGKQRLTALARQRLRMRRSWTCQGEVDQTVVEESPMKQFDNHSHRSTSHSEIKSKRSPRHSIMLTRRHSFYKDGSDGNCRTVARAKVVQLHKEAVPATPRTNPTFLSSQSKVNPVFSPNTLLFSYVRSDTANNGPNLVKSETKTRRKLKLFNEQQNFASSREAGGNVQNTNGSDSAPDDSMQPIVTVSQQCAPSQVDLNSSDENYPPCDSEAPFQSYASDIAGKLANDKQSAPATNQALPPLQHKPQLKAQKSDDRWREIRSPPKLVLARQSVARRSPRIARQFSEEKPVESTTVGPLDQFVIRTPTPVKKVKQNCSPLLTSCRKTSPNGDHIQKWPRKKRISANTPPSHHVKRRKGNVYEKEGLSRDSMRLPAKISDCLRVSEPGDSPGIEMDEFVKSWSPRKSQNVKSTRSTSADNPRDIGVLSTSQPLPTPTRWTSPRQRHTGTLYRAPVGSGKSFIPMVLLDEHSE